METRQGTWRVGEDISMLEARAMVLSMRRLCTNTKWWKHQANFFVTISGLFSLLYAVDQATVEF